MKKTAIIVGSEGQDGSYLFEKLQSAGYIIIGIDQKKIRSSLQSTIKPIDITKPAQVAKIVKEFKPSEIYYLAAFHQASEDIKSNDVELFQKSYLINVLSLINFLEAINKYSKHSRLFYAASSHMFGNPEKNIQNEKTPFKPVCVYGISKTMGIHACRFYRKQHSLFISAGILYNHESPRRAGKFVTRKIIKTAVAIKRGKAKNLTIGDMTAKVDWGYAPDYVEAMHRILQHSVPDDFIIASGQTKTIKQFVEAVFKKLNLDWRKYVKEDTALIQKKQKTNLMGDIKKIKKELGWKPQVNFNKMIDIMIEAEINMSHPKKNQNFHSANTP